MVALAESAEMFSLYRYYLSAETMRDAFESIASDQSRRRRRGDVEPHLYLSYWLGGLYVVIEGWKMLGVSDPAINQLLNSPHVALLRRYRDEVFHFREDYYDERFLSFMAEGQAIVPFARTLDEAFGRFFLDWFEQRRMAFLVPGRVAPSQTNQAEPSQPGVLVPAGVEQTTKEVAHEVAAVP